MPIWLIHKEHGKYPAALDELTQLTANGWEIDPDRLDMDRLPSEQHIKPERKTLTLKKGKK